MTGCRERPSHAARAPRGSDTTRPSRDGAAAAWDDAHLDGLFTYCLSLMCEHDAATAALGEALAQAERRQERGRHPADPALLRSWLYALARWSCLRRLGTGDGRAAGRAVPRAAGEDADRRRRELAALGWPEAAGTTPGQREALELAVRHQLAPREVARVLRLPEQATRTLLTAGAREVERTRAALAAVTAASCPAAAALSGDDPNLLLGPGLRRELLRHVAECPSCRLIAQRAMAGAGGAGAAGASRLAVLPAPRAAVHAAALAVRRARAQHAPRYDRAGFPFADRDRAARRERLRGRAVTTTVVAAALAAPVLALWAAYRAAPVIGEAVGRDDPAAAAAEDSEYRADVTQEHPYEHAGRAEPGGAGADSGTGRGDAEEEEGEGDADRRGEESPGDASGAGREEDAEGGGDEGGRDSGGADQTAPGRLVVDAVPTETGTRVTLTASGDSAVRWTAATDADWLSLNQTSGTLRPGETAVIQITVDHAREPSGPWQGRITIDPAAAVITVEGEGPAAPEPSGPPPAEPEPTDPPPTGAPDPGVEPGAV
ncbi:BACON domain-containing protein [Streptomyces sp. URMC 129]|uniref:BACON domain-containing protein n=1 Tax=Streptomyces sp. URMC 129 TaxID=3423407 RepID=UPI003F1E1F56